MKKRAEVRDRTRDRIIQATLVVHDDKGVAPATFAEIAERAGVGQATVHRHFPTLSDLVRACGVHVWQEMRPPTPDAAAAIFASCATRPERMVRFVEELDAFYARGAHRLRLVARDRELVPELDQFLTVVEAGIEALAREALGEAESDRAVKVVAAVSSLPMWSALGKLGLTPSGLTGLKVRLLECAVKATGQA